jgi:hypothetical protein
MKLGGRYLWQHMPTKEPAHLWKSNENIVNEKVY